MLNYQGVLVGFINRSTFGTSPRASPCIPYPRGDVPNHSPSSSFSSSLNSTFAAASVSPPSCGVWTERKDIIKVLRKHVAENWISKATLKVYIYIYIDLECYSYVPLCPPQTSLKLVINWQKTVFRFGGPSVYCQKLRPFTETTQLVDIGQFRLWISMVDMIYWTSSLETNKVDLGAPQLHHIWGCSIRGK